MLSGVDIGVDYKSFLELLVGSLDNESCMFGECPRCPSLYEGIYFGRFK
jgi:hypothetical protein